MSLAEALVTLALLCIFAVPAFNWLRQSTENYVRACAAYKTDLVLNGLLAEAKNAVDDSEALENAIVLSRYEDYEWVIIVEDFQSGELERFEYPASNSVELTGASISGETGNFTGLITAAVKDIATGVIKIRGMPF
ncbi:MAG: hypothetical protein LBS84_04285 [Clostridiales bacterium]|nr:hypothetical protein [Clostridiales bacterium]